MFHATLECLEEGIGATNANIAKKLGVTRQNISKMLLRHPDLADWINRLLLQRGTARVGHVVAAVTRLAERGSPQHADIFLKYTAGGYAPRAGLPFTEAGEAVPLNVNHYTLNMLVPRPEVPALTPAPAAVPVAAIPTVAVR